MKDSDIYVHRYLPEDGLNFIKTWVKKNVRAIFKRLDFSKGWEVAIPDWEDHSRIINVIPFLNNKEYLQVQKDSDGGCWVLVFDNNHRPNIVKAIKEFDLQKKLEKEHGMSPEVALNTVRTISKI